MVGFSVFSSSLFLNCFSRIVITAHYSLFGGRLIILAWTKWREYRVLLVFLSSLIWIVHSNVFGSIAIVSSYWICYTTSICHLIYIFITSVCVCVSVYIAIHVNCSLTSCLNYYLLRTDIQKKPEICIRISRSTLTHREEESDSDWFEIVVFVFLSCMVVRSLQNIQQIRKL